MVVSMIVHDSCIHSNRWNRLESGPIHYHIGQYSKSYFTKHLKHFISKVRPKGNFSSSNSTSFLDCPHVPEIVWYVLLTELQSLVKNSNFGKFHWAAFWKSDIFAEILILSNPQFKPKLKPRLKGFLFWLACHLMSEFEIALLKLTGFIMEQKLELMKHWKISDRFKTAMI